MAHLPPLAGAEPGLQAEPQPMAPVNSDVEPGVLSGHAAQVRLPALAAYMVGAQGVHLSSPSAGAYEPGAQGVHDMAPGLLYLPAGQLVQAPPPVFENLPAAQGLQAVMPIDRDSVPGRQLLHLLPPEADMNLPATQLRQPKLPEEDTEPGRQAAQDTEPFVVVAVPLGHPWQLSVPTPRWYVLTGHAVQLLDPKAPLKDPAAQGVQLEAPAAFAYVPRGQLRQVCTPGGANWPGKQGLQLCGSMIWL